MGLFDFFKSSQRSSPPRPSNVPDSIMRDCRKLGTDLVELVNSGPCCSVCAIYRNRIYSISGKTNRFPRFPDNFRPNCCLSAYPFVLGVSEPAFNCKDIISYSNRPFVDDRSKAEIKKYNDWQARMREKELQQLRLEKAKVEFAWIQKNLPSIAPKSLSGYSKMKSSNSANYRKIVEEAAKRGYKIT